ncbi:MAG: hypothetical protein R3C56_21785 [Pirellulaceae bacterium]
MGSSSKLKWEMVDGKPTLMKLPAIDFIDDKQGKPVGIQKHIGRPSLLLAAQMATYRCSNGPQPVQARGSACTSTIPMPSVNLPTTAIRTSASRTRARRSRRQGWTVVDMKNDWKTIFPPPR